MVNMARNNSNSTHYPRPANRGGYVYLMKIGHSQRGHGVGGIFEGWANRAIPIIKSKAKSLGKEIAVQGLDTAYESSRNYITKKLGLSKDSSKFVKTSKKNAIQPKKAIKRKITSNPFSHSQSIKRKRPNKKITRRHGFKKSSGFRKVTL